MLNKIYVKIKQIISSNYLFIIGIIIGLFISLYEFPYYIESPGGVISVSSKIKIDGSKSKGDFNMAYVADYKPTIFNLIRAKLNKDWDIEKKSNEKIDEEIYIRDRLLLEEANQNAVILAYKKAGKDVQINKSDIYITYIYEEAKTDIGVGDKILKVDGEMIYEKLDLLEAINNHDVGDNVSITVANNNKVYERTAEVIEVDGIKLVGVMLSVINDYTVEPNIEFSFSKSESGPSGGLIMSLAIYNSLIDEDITGGKKIAGTGTIDIDGNVGSIGGVTYKIKGAVKDKVKYFLIPSGENYEEAMKIKSENNYDINIYPVSTFDEALEILKNLE